jgi:hypothetical protein
MKWVRNILREVFGLFVDDGSFALAILVWIGTVWLVLRRTRLAVPGGIILFVGLGLILIEGVIRFSRRAVDSITYLEINRGEQHVSIGRFNQQ